MKVQRVVTNQTCNQNCWFCNARQPAEQADFIARGAVRQRIAAAGPAQEIILTGGEPTLRSDIAELVGLAKGHAERVVIETNAARIDGERARSLRAAGLDLARV